jgi:hypothetical protein
MRAAALIATAFLISTSLFAAFPSNDLILPDWFGALNQEFRYQLTAIGAPGPNLYVAEEIANNRFKIAGGKPGMKVSWQVTGIRHDVWAEAHRIQVEVEKPATEQGTYLTPELYGQPPEKGRAYEIHRRLGIE